MSRIAVAICWLMPVILGGGCSGPEPPCGLALCDIRNLDCQRRLAESTGCMRGAPTPNVPVILQSRAELEALAASPPPEEQARLFETWSTALALFGLADPNTTLIDQRTARVNKLGGQYSPADKAITVIADEEADLSSRGYVGLLIHEYVHAIQDAAIDLTAFSSVHENDLDDSLGANAMIEGDATVVADRAEAWLWGRDPDSIAWEDVFSTWQRNTRKESLESTAPVRLSGFFFHYSFGAPFVEAARATGGWDAVEALFGQPPSGARQLMWGAAATEPDGGPWEEDLGDDAVPVLPSQFAFVGWDRLGAWTLDQYLLRAIVPPPADDSLARGVTGASLPAIDPAASALRGDVFSVFTDTNSGATLVAWRLRLATFKDATELTSNLYDRRREVDQPNWEFGIVGLDADLLLLAASQPGELAALPNPAYLTFQAVPSPPATNDSVSPTTLAIP